MKIVNSVNNTGKNKNNPKVPDSVNNRTFFIGYSNFGKTYLMNHILLKKDPSVIITKSLIQYPIINAQTLNEIEPLQNYENSTVVFDDMLLSKQESNIDLFFTRGRHNNTDLYYVSQSYFHFPKNTILNNSNKKILYKQTVRDIILLFHDIAGLDMSLEEWKQQIC